jgi:hypothetical protein
MRPVSSGSCWQYKKNRDCPLLSLRMLPRLKMRSILCFASLVPLARAATICTLYVWSNQTFASFGWGHVDTTTGTITRDMWLPQIHEVGNGVCAGAEQG